MQLRQQGTEVLLRAEDHNGALVAAGLGEQLDGLGGSRVFGQLQALSPSLRGNGCSINAPSSTVDRSSGEGGDAHFVEQATDAAFDLVADRADVLDALACRVAATYRDTRFPIAHDTARGLVQPDRSRPTVGRFGRVRFRYVTAAVAVAPCRRAPTAFASFPRGRRRRWVLRRRVGSAGVRCRRWATRDLRGWRMRSMPSAHMRGYRHGLSRWLRAAQQHLTATPPRCGTARRTM